MRVRRTALIWAAPLLATCSGGNLQPGQDAGQRSDVGQPADVGQRPDLSIHPTPAVDGPTPVDPGDPPPTDAWSVFAKIGAPGLRKIWGTSDSDIWVAGVYFAESAGPVLLEGPGGPSSLPRVVHYDGTSWRDVAVPGTATPWEIWGLGPNDVWTTGSAIRHFDGVAWREVPSPAGAMPVWGAATNDVWFGSERMMLHWNGSTITAVPSPAVDTLLSLWGFSSSDVWAGGGGGGLIHWDGQRWSAVPTGTTLYIYGLWGARPDDVWGVGNGGNRVHWNGAGITASELGYTSFLAVTGAGRDDIWGVGECCWQIGGSKAWVSHYDGAQWKDGTVAGYGQVSGVWASPSGSFYAMTDSSTVLRAGTGAGGSPDAGGSAVCAADLTSQVNALVDDLQHDGGPCAGVLDCKLFVPTVACGADFRVTGCPTVVADVDAARAQVAALEAPGCASILSDPACHAQIFVDCPAPIAACQAGRCTSIAPP